MDVLLLENSGTEQSPSATQLVLRNAQLLYPVVLLLAFILSAAVHTVVTSRTEEELVAPTVKGPGGKPLPVTKRKREQDAQQAADKDGGAGGAGGRLAWKAFVYLTVAVILSFVANGVVMAARAVRSSRRAAPNQWWCGEERIVSLALVPPPPRDRGPPGY